MIRDLPSHRVHHWMRWLRVTGMAMSAPKNGHRPLGMPTPVSFPVPALVLVLVLVLVIDLAPPVDAFECPDKLAEHTLTMQCRDACPVAMSPCLFHATASQCRHARADTSTRIANTTAISDTVCVSDTTGTCAFECLLPFSGANGEAWRLLVVEKAEYVHDVVDMALRDDSYRVARQPLAELSTIHDLSFPSTASTIVVTGNALPIVDKTVEYPVIRRGDTISLQMNDFAFLSNVTEATTLILENLNLSQLKSFPMLPQLEELQLANGLLHTVPEGIADLPALKRLDLALNSIPIIGNNTLPPTIEDLCLQDCALVQLPTDILRMPNLRKLELSGNLFQLPPEGSLPLQIENLAMWGLYHKRLPPDFPFMAKLTVLEMGWNDFSDASALSLLPTSLQELHLIDVLLTEIPPSFTNLSQLAWVDFSQNALKTVPAAALPASLRFLNLSVNWLESIAPDALPPALETLDLAVNVLPTTGLPSNLSTLTQLGALYLHDNALTTLPSSLYLLPSLRTLTLHGNPIVASVNDSANATSSTRLTFTDQQLVFLAQLTSFSIDQSVLETRCDAPVLIANTEYTVCRTGDATIRASDDGASGSNTDDEPSTSNDTLKLVLGVGLSLGGLLVILIGAVHWKQRRSHGDGTGSGSVAPLFPASGADPTMNDDTKRVVMMHTKQQKAGTVVWMEQALHESGDVNDPDYRLETSHATSYSAMEAVTFGSMTSTAMVMADSRGTTAKSIWDDQELLSCRLDSQAIHEVELLAGGVFGEVWLASYYARQVAVKRLNKPMPGRGHSDSLTRNRLQRFVREIKCHSRCEHPKIVAVLGVSWTMESDLQLVMEYMTQGDLRTYLSSLSSFGPSSTSAPAETLTHRWDESSLRIALDITEALVFLHSLDPPMLHCDVKSRNVLLNDSGCAKLSDFGLSRYQRIHASSDASKSKQEQQGQQDDKDDDDDDAEVVATMTAEIATARWAAPELLAGSSLSSSSSAVDMYSLGVFLSELDTWALPFADQKLPESALLARICTGELQPTFASDSPAEIVALAQRCLNLEPRERPTAVEVAYVLRQCLTECTASMARRSSMSSASAFSVGTGAEFSESEAGSERGALWRWRESSIGSIGSAAAEVETSSNRNTIVEEAGEEDDLTVATTTRRATTRTIMETALMAEEQHTEQTHQECWEL